MATLSGVIRYIKRWRCRCSLIDENGVEREFARSELDDVDTIKQYAKLNLVPFSEHIPFDNIFPLLNYVDLGEGDFSSGKTILVWGRDFKYSPTICYEVVYPGFIRKIKKLGAVLLVNITNDGWFGDSIEPYQHMQLARMRAIETGRYLLRATNTGLTGIVSPDGAIKARAPLFTVTALTGEITPMGGMTPYARIGDTPILFFIVALLVLCLQINYKKDKLN